VHPPPVATLNVTSRVFGETHAVTVRGEIDIAVVDVLAAAMHRALADAPEIVLLDLSAVTFIDVAGVRAILAAHRHARACGTRMTIVPAVDGAQRVFALIGVESTLPFVAEPTTRALASTGRARRSRTSTPSSQGTRSNRLRAASRRASHSGTP
jgi:anti-sigma B factor antagonist